MQDERLLTKLGDGRDLTASDSMYHAKCLVSLYNRARDREAIDVSDDLKVRRHGIAFAQLVAYIDDMKCSDDTQPVFKLTQLADMYTTRLTQMGENVTARINTTKLKDRLLAHFPDMRAQLCGRNVLLMFDKDIGGAISGACQQTYDEDAMCLAKAAEIVRHGLFDSSDGFNGTFTSECQENSVPFNLTLLVNMILEGPSIEQQSKKLSTQSALSIAQLVKFNSVKHARKCETSYVRHNTNQETPLPLYISLLLHGTERSQHLIEKLFTLGLRVNYDHHLLKIAVAMGNSVSDNFDNSHDPCPPGFFTGLFTTGAVDNIDHNPSSKTSTNSFHSTAISLTSLVGPFLRAVVLISNSG